MKLIEYLEAGVLPDESAQAWKIAAQAPSFTLVNGVLYFVDPKCPKQKRAVVPVHLQEQLMQDSHGGVMAGHFSRNRLFAMLSRHWWWETLHRDDQLLQELPGVHRRIWFWTSSATPTPSHPSSAPISQIMGVDIMELPMTEQGNKYVIVMQDFLTKWPLVFAAPEKATRIAHLLVEEVVPMFGVPEALYSPIEARICSLTLFAMFASCCWAPGHC